jgi:AcrR family transcriptional regulator
MSSAEGSVDRGQRSEQALADAAAEVIAERGITGASFRLIGERAGTSRGLPTHHFGSKDALVARIAQRAQDHVQEIMAAAVLDSTREPHDITGRDLVRLLVHTYLGLFDDPTPDERALLVMWGSTFPSRSSIDGMIEADHRSYEGWADQLARGQRDGSIRPDLDVEAGAVILHGMLRGIAALALTGSPGTDLTAVRRSVDAWLEYALGPRDDAEPGAGF